jgi:hypothetical protein
MPALLRARRALVIVLALVAGYCCFRIHEAELLSHQARADEMELSSITYGLFNPDEWKNVLTGIITKKINDFQITESNREQLKKQVVGMLTHVVNEMEQVVNEKNKKGGLGGLMRGILMDVLVDVDDIRSGIPRYADQILDYLNDPVSRDELKGFVLARVDSMAAATVGTVDYSRLNHVLERNGLADRETGIIYLRELRALADAELWWHGHLLCGVLLLYLVLLFFPAGAGSVELWTGIATAAGLLVTALSLPMIDIEATIASFSFSLIGEPVEFHDQVLFYESKSILQVVSLLLKEDDAGLVLVAVLIFSFSVLIPFLKLVTSFVAIVRKRVPHKGIMRFLVLHSGKWSMADVMVVALFMAYLGFNGVVNSQLGELKVSTTLARIMTTNNSSLEIGFHLFTAYCIMGLLISVLITRRGIASGAQPA